MKAKTGYIYSIGSSRWYCVKFDGEYIQWRNITTGAIIEPHPSKGSIPDEYTEIPGFEIYLKQLEDGGL